MNLNEQGKGPKDPNLLSVLTRFSDFATGEPDRVISTYWAEHRNILCPCINTNMRKHYLSATSRLMFYSYSLSWRFGVAGLWMVLSKIKRYRCYVIDAGTRRCSWFILVLYKSSVVKMSQAATVVTFAPSSQTFPRHRIGGRRRSVHGNNKLTVQNGKGRAESRVR